MTEADKSCEASLAAERVGSQSGARMAGGVASAIAVSLAAAYLISPGYAEGARTGAVLTASVGGSEPRASGDAGAALRTVKTLLAAISAGDASQAAALLRPVGTATVLMEDGGAVRSAPLSRFAEVDPGQPLMDERLIVASVRSDGHIASVWGRYRSASGHIARHCGTSHYDLVRDQGRWLVQNVTWTVRATGCGASDPQ